MRGAKSLRLFGFRAPSFEFGGVPCFSLPFAAIFVYLKRLTAGLKMVKRFGSGRRFVTLSIGMELSIPKEVSGY